MDFGGGAARPRTRAPSRFLSCRPMYAVTCNADNATFRQLSSRETVLHSDCTATTQSQHGMRACVSQRALPHQGPRTQAWRLGGVCVGTREPRDEGSMLTFIDLRLAHTVRRLHTCVWEASESRRAYAGTQLSRRCRLRTLFCHTKCAGSLRRNTAVGSRRNLRSRSARNVGEVTWQSTI